MDKFNNNLKIIALIPARSGSKRIPHKNLKILNEHPLLAYSIQAAIDSKIFNSIVCATDKEDYADIARYYGAEVPLLRPSNISGSISPDIEWVAWILNILKDHGREFDVFSILRPTCPFRLPETIKFAWNQFKNNQKADSLRAVEKSKQHPGKMWVIRGNRILPILPFSNNSIPWHSSQYAALPEIYTQNASLEFAWTRIVFENYTISGESITPFISKNQEGFDINNPEDLILAEHYVKTGEAVLPIIHDPPYNSLQNIKQ